MTSSTVRYGFTAVYFARTEATDRSDDSALSVSTFVTIASVPAGVSMDLPLMLLTQTHCVLWQQGRVHYAVLACDGCTVRPYTKRHQSPFWHRAPPPTTTPIKLKTRSHVSLAILFLCAEFNFVAWAHNM